MVCIRVAEHPVTSLKAASHPSGSFSGSLWSICSRPSSNKYTVAQSYIGRVGFEGGEDCDSAGFFPEKEKDA